MTSALSADQRSTLEKLVQRARRWIEEDLEAKLAGVFGIHPDGRIEDIAGLSLSNAQTSVRDDLVELITFLRSEGEGDEGSVARLVREAAFTHTNRLIAVRVAEAIRLLPETIAKGTASSGFRDFSELAPTVATTEWGRFAEFLRLCADELAADVPALFDPRNPLLELTISEPVLAKVIDAISTLGNELWAAPDTLGWAYQFFNTGEERREMRESSAPRNSRELAVRNQFFTPSYVVEFLVHNGLGAHLVAGFPDLADELPLLVEVPTERVEVDLAAVSVLDPACGSGHFLLGAYDVLERAWHHAGVEPAEAAPAIVRSLWGIDIDPRAAQIAQAAVMFRARRHCRDEKLPPANVICARSLPSGSEIDAFIVSLPGHVGRAVKGIAEELVDAPVLGPLLKVEERLDRDVRDVFGTGAVEGTLAEAAWDESERVEAAVLDALSAIADSTTSTASQRLLAAEAHDAVRFVEAMSRRYTAVLMNPPFGPPVEVTKSYINKAFPLVPKGGYLEASFLDRGFDLTEPDGSIGIVSSRAVLFLPTFRDWRDERLLGGQLATLLDVGHGLMEQALVEAIAAVVNPSPKGDRTTVISLLRSQDRERDLRAILTGGELSSVEVYRTDAADLAALPTHAFAYWADRHQLEIWRDWNSVEPTWGEVRKGSWPGGDFRHLRLWWEVSYSKKGRKSWRPYAKGGPYAPYYNEPHLVVDWDDERDTFWEFYGRKHRASSIPENREYYGRPGLTWSLRTASGLSVRVLPAGCVIANKGPGVFAPGDDHASLYLSLAWLNSRPARSLLDLQLAAGEETSSGSASRSYEVGLIRSIPVPPISETDARTVVSSCRAVTTAIALERTVDERSLHFNGLYALDGEPLDAWLRRRFVQWLDRVSDGYVSINQIETIFGSYIEHESGWVSQGAGALVSEYDSIIDASKLIDVFALSEDQVVDRALSELGGRRYLAVPSFHIDRRVELMCHLFEANPTEIIGRLRSSSPPRWFVDEWCRRLLSFAAGAGFGRWEAGRSSPPPALDFESLSRPENTGSDRVTDSRGLVASIIDAAVEFRFSAALLNDAAVSLGYQQGLTQYVDSALFQDHLSKYSMSRRKAPIYWQLQVPSKTWGVWLYAPKLSREMLFAIVSQTEQRQRLAEQQIGHLQREAENGSGGRTASEVAKELEAEQRLAVELASFRSEAERIANLGWEPDLDDGMVLNAAPLADLFPAWKEAAAYRKELRAGKYEWATVARYADQL